MPPRHVYGKRARAVYAPVLLSSSAEKSPVQASKLKKERQRRKESNTAGEEDTKAKTTDPGQEHAGRSENKDVAPHKALQGKLGEEICVLEVADELSRLNVQDASNGSPEQSEGSAADGKSDKRGEKTIRDRKALGETSGNAGIPIKSSTQRVKKTEEKENGRSKRRGKVENDHGDERIIVASRRKDDDSSEISDGTLASTANKDRESTTGRRRRGTEERFESNTPKVNTGLGNLTLSSTEYEAVSRPSSGSQSNPQNETLRHTSAASHLATTHCAALLSLSNHAITPFTTWSAQLTTHFAITKIAEASFGEVYRLSLLEPLPDFTRSDESVIKVIALKPPPAALAGIKSNRERAAKRLQAEDMSSPDDVATEVRTLQRMSAIPGYTNFRDVRVVQGRPAEGFVEAFERFEELQRKRGKEASVFPDPGDGASYDDQQLWAVIEMQNAGIDLERLVEEGECRSIWRVWDVFWQAVLALAKGEEGAEFEHRDLHLGNLCIRRHGDPLIRSIAKGAGSTTEEAGGRLDIDPSLKLNFTNIETTLIDYTLSRARMSSLTPQSSPSKSDSNNIAYVDLSRDPTLFTADSETEYQYEIYRYMRGALLLDDPLADFSQAATIRQAEEATREDHLSSLDGASGRSWEQFHPVTNLLWLHFVLYMLLEQVHWPSEQKASETKSSGCKCGKKATAAKKGGRKGQVDAVAKRAEELEKVLLRVQDLLDPGMICERRDNQGGLRGAGDLVGLALREGWFDVEDVLGEDWEDEIEVEVDEVKGDDAEDSDIIVVASTDR